MNSDMDSGLREVKVFLSQQRVLMIFFVNVGPRLFSYIPSSANSDSKLKPIRWQILFKFLLKKFKFLKFGLRRNGFFLTLFLRGGGCHRINTKKWFESIKEIFCCVLKKLLNFSFIFCNNIYTFLQNQFSAIYNGKAHVQVE